MKSLSLLFSNKKKSLYLVKHNSPIVLLMKKSVVLQQFLHSYTNRYNVLYNAILLLCCHNICDKVTD